MQAALNGVNNDWLTMRNVSTLVLGEAWFFFSAPPACWEGLLLIYSVCNVWRGFVEKLRLGAEISCVSQRKKGFGNLLNVNFDWERLILENTTPATISDEKMLPTEKIEKARLVCNIFVYLNNDWNSCHFSNWEPGARPKLTHAHYVFPLWICEYLILDPRALVFYHVTDGDKSSGEPWTKLFRYLLLVETKKARLIGQSATR